MRRSTARAEAALRQELRRRPYPVFSHPRLAHASNNHTDEHRADATILHLHSLFAPTFMSSHTARAHKFQVRCRSAGRTLATEATTETASCVVQRWQPATDVGSTDFDFGDLNYSKSEFTWACSPDGSPTRWYSGLSCRAVIPRSCHPLGKQGARGALNRDPLDHRSFRAAGTYRPCRNALILGG